MNEHAEIILIEKEDHVSFANCGLPYHIGGEITERAKLLVATPEFLRKRFRIDVRVAQEVTEIDRERKEVVIQQRDSQESNRLAYDKLILSPGASPIIPHITGVDADNVLTLRNLSDMDRIKAYVDSGRLKRAIVVGSGFIGLEMVEQLVRREVKTALVELQSHVLPMMDPEMTEPIKAELVSHGVDLHLGTAVESITTDENGLACGVILSDGSQLEGDLVILGIGVRSNSQLAVNANLETGRSGAIVTNNLMQTSDPDIYAVGDAVEYVYGPTGEPARIAMAGPANRAGRLAGQHAAVDDAEPMQEVWGTAIVRVFGISAGFTGLTGALADRLGVESAHATVVAKNHAGYFPGSEMMTLKLSYSPENGRVLGCQVVGGEGCDKRLDVVATAMHFGGDVRRLAGVDLAYAPPFGSAKDPVHLASFVASNALDGIESFCDAGADLSGRKCSMFAHFPRSNQSHLLGLIRWSIFPSMSYEIGSASWVNRPMMTSGSSRARSGSEVILPRGF
ncbi:MAG: FAD-dependent oxidoreductase [Rubripirellula sp.]|nr:FAD-dependent oxidoreductase [Rubripirellula sp.]